MNYIVTTTNITKQYKDTTALNNVSVHIPRGSIYGLVGNNGAGKTTLMRLLLGLQNPTSGQIKIADNIKTGAISVLVCQTKLEISAILDKKSKVQCF